MKPTVRFLFTDPVKELIRLSAKRNSVIFVESGIINFSASPKVRIWSPRRYESLRGTEPTHVLIVASSLTFSAYQLVMMQLGRRAGFLQRPELIIVLQ